MFIAIDASGKKETVKAEIYSKITDASAQEAIAKLIDLAPGDSCMVGGSISYGDYSGSLRLTAQFWTAREK